MFKNNFQHRLIIHIITILIVLILLSQILSHVFSESLTYTIIAHFLLLLILIPILYFRVGKPLNLLLKVCQTEDPTFIEQYLNFKNLLGQLAAQIHQYSQNKKKLLSEIAERTHMENALRESEARYRNLVEISPDAIILMNFTGVILLSNQRASHLLGIDPDYTQLDDNIYLYLPDVEHDHFIEIFKQIRKKECIKPFECLMKKNTSTEVFNAEMSLSLIKNSAGEPNALICVVRDISERKKSEIEKSKLEEQFRSVYKMEAIGQLAGGIAHDFNNILGAISGYSDIILLRYSNDEKLVKYAKMILSASNRASVLTKKLLTFSRKSKIEMSSFDAHTVLLETTEILTHTIDKSITITTDFKSNQSIIYGDAAQFQSAIMNLTLNARDAMPEGGEITISTDVAFLDKKLTVFHSYTITPGNYLSISIKDTGMGMDQDVLSHLFEPFFTTKGIGKGTGLGLASVYGTVKSHSGFIDVQSEPTKGSTFTMYLPAQLQSIITEKNATRKIRTGKGNILIVDDEAIMRDAVKEMLSWLGYTVKTCCDSNEAIDYYSNNPDSVDLVIMDMVMPGINGRECYKRMKQINGNIKVLLATGHRIDEERKSIIEEGIIGILQKPFASSQLAQAVHDALELK